MAIKNMGPIHLASQMYQGIRSLDMDEYKFEENIKVIADCTCFSLENNTS